MRVLLLSDVYNQGRPRLCVLHPPLPPLLPVLLLRGFLHFDMSTTTLRTVAAARPAVKVLLYDIILLTAV